MEVFTSTKPLASSGRTPEIGGCERQTGNIEAGFVGWSFLYSPFAYRKRIAAVMPGRALLPNAHSHGQGLIFVQLILQNILTDFSPSFTEYCSQIAYQLVCCTRIPPSPPRLGVDQHVLYVFHMSTRSTEHKLR